MNPARFGTVVHRKVPAQLASRIGARARAGQREARPAVAAIAVPVAAQSWMAQAMPANLEGGLALFVSALQGSLAAGSAVGGIVYDATGSGGTLVLAGVVAALGARTLLGRAGAAISSPSADPADLADLAGERGQDAPAPPPGAIDPAANSA